MFKLLLRRCGEETNTKRDYYLKDGNKTSHALVIPGAGHVSSGPNAFTLDGYIAEHILHYCDDETGRILARARLITLFDAERLKMFSVFRERPSQLRDFDTPFAEAVSADVAASDLVATEAEATLDSVCGLWRGTTTDMHVEVARDEGRPDIGLQELPYESRWSLDDNGGSLVIEEVADMLKTQMRGTVSSNGRSVWFADENQSGSRLVFLGGGVVAHASVMHPTIASNVFVEFIWLIKPDFRLRMRTNFDGHTWIGSSFISERKI